MSAMDISQLLDRLEGELRGLQVEQFNLEAQAWKLRAAGIFRRLIAEDDPLMVQLLAIEFFPYPRSRGVQFAPSGWKDLFEAARSDALGVIKAMRHHLELDATGLTVKGTGDPLARLHPAIREVSGDHFLGGRYRNAVLDAFIAVEERVKSLSGLQGVVGSPLMGRAFSGERPPIAVNALENDAHRVEQEGFKLIYMGASTGIRGPKAHTMIDQRDPDRTLDYLSLASLLMRRLDDAEKLKS